MLKARKENLQNINISNIFIYFFFIQKLGQFIFEEWNNYSQLSQRHPWVCTKINYDVT